MRRFLPLICFSIFALAGGLMAHSVLGWLAVLTLGGWLATLLLAVLTIHKLTLFTSSSGEITLPQWPYMALCAFVAFYWIAPWEQQLGRWKAERVAQKPGGLIIRWGVGLPEMPVAERPRPHVWGAVFMAETGVYFFPPSSIVGFRDYYRGFYEVMEAKVKERFGDDIFHRVTQKAIDLKGEMPEPMRKLAREEVYFSGWTEGRFLSRFGTLSNRTVALRYQNDELRRFEAEGYQIIAWDVVNGELLIRSSGGRSDYYERFHIGKEERIELIKDHVPEWAAGLTAP